VDRTRLSWGNGSGIVTVGFCRSPDSGVGEGSTVGAPNRPKVRPYDRMIYWYNINKIICFEVECRSYRMGLMKAYVLIWRFMIQDVNACGNSTWHDAVGPVVGWHEDWDSLEHPKDKQKDVGFAYIPDLLREVVHVSIWCMWARLPDLFPAVCVTLNVPRHLPAFPKP